MSNFVSGSVSSLHENRWRAFCDDCGFRVLLYSKVDHYLWVVCASSLQENSHLTFLFNADLNSRENTFEFTSAEAAFAHYAQRSVNYTRWLFL